MLLIAATAATACGGGDEDTNAAGESGDSLRVVATTVQIEALTQEIADGKVELDGIIPAGADSHDFEPVASDLAKIERADLILRHGIGLDDWLNRSLSASKARTVTVTEGIALKKPAIEHGHEDEEDESEHADEDEAHADEEGLDPHVWHDPDNVKVMVDNIAAALTEADPEQGDTYKARAEAYKQALDETKAEVQAIIDEIPQENRKLVTNHDAFGYFARAFGLEIVGAVIPSASTEAEPSARQTAELLETIERENVRAIFAESSVNSTLARTLANDAGVMIVDDLYGDSLGEPGSGAETLDGMLRANAQKIANALK